MVFVSCCSSLSSHAILLGLRPLCYLGFTRYLAKLWVFAHYVAWFSYTILRSDKHDTPSGARQSTSSTWSRGARSSWFSRTTLPYAPPPSFAARFVPREALSLRTLSCRTHLTSFAACFVPRTSRCDASPRPFQPRQAALLPVHTEPCSKSLRVFLFPFCFTEVNILPLNLPLR